MKNISETKEKRTITKVVTVRFIGIKILTFTTEMPKEMSFIDFNSLRTAEALSVRNGTDEASL